MSFIVEAIRNLAPNAEFAFSGEDLTTLDWHSTDIAKPSIAAIQAEVAKVKKAKETQAEDKAAAKSALLAKLGITAEEAALLLG
jgi:hypothetical protein